MSRKGLTRFVGWAYPSLAVECIPGRRRSEYGVEGQGRGLHDGGGRLGTRGVGRGTVRGRSDSTETCFIADQHPQIALSITPADAVKMARIHFHSALGTAFYYVEMQRQGGYFRRVLPKPKLEAGPVTYYVEAFDNAFGQFRRLRSKAKVVQRSDECETNALAATTTPAGALVVLGGAGVPAASRAWRAWGWLRRPAVAGRAPSSPAPPHHRVERRRTGGATPSSW